MFEVGVEVTSIGVKSSPQERVSQNPHRQNGDAVQTLTDEVLDTGRLASCHVTDMQLNSILLDFC